MRGKYQIIIQNKRIRYNFEVKRNITIIRGNSATGKTVLVEMVREYNENGNDSGIELKCEKACTVLSGKNWKMQLSMIKNSIIFIDEGNSFVASKEFATAIQKTDNYYVIVTREGLSTLPYSVEEIYGICNSGKYGSLKQTYNEFYHIYGKQEYTVAVVPQQIITEDSNAGFQFYKDICEGKGKECISARGKSNIFSVALSVKGTETLIIADGAAFGSEMEKMIKLLQLNDKLHLYLPESFEWLILKSGLLEDADISNILAKPYDYVESAENFSWERYFTGLLVDKTATTYMKYTKSTLNPFYLQQKSKEQILEGMEAKISLI